MKGKISPTFVLAVAGLLATIAGIYFPLAASEDLPPFGNSPSVSPTATSTVAVTPTPAETPTVTPTRQLELVSHRVSREECDAAVLEIAVQNQTDKEVVLKRAEFKVRNVWQLAPTLSTFCRVLTPTAGFNVSLQVGGAFQTLELDPLIAVEPGKAESIVFIIKDDRGTRGDTVFHIGMQLIYGADDRSLTVPDLLFVANMPGSYADSSPEEKGTAEAIERTEGTKSGSLQRLIQTVLDAPDP